MTIKEIREPILGRVVRKIGIIKSFQQHQVTFMILNKRASKYKTKIEITNTKTLIQPLIRAELIVVQVQNLQIKLGKLSM